MNEQTGPQKENGYTPIANEILEALAQTNLSPYESRVLWAILRKTYGWGKKSDSIPLSQLADVTGMSRAHICRAKAKLLQRDIIAQTGNELSFNKFHTQWRALPKQATRQMRLLPKQATEVLPKQATTLPKQAIKSLPKQAHSKERITKETFQKKDGPDQKCETTKPLTDEQIIQMGRDFKRLTVESQWCDEAYAEKTWEQSRQLRTDNRNEFYRKVTLMLTWVRLPKHKARAKLLFHEVAGFLNDRGAIERQLDDAEVARRRQFAREESGEPYVRDELDPT